MQRIPYLLEKEKMLKLRNNETSNTQTHVINLKVIKGFFNVTY